MHAPVHRHRARHPGRLSGHDRCVQRLQQGFGRLFTQLPVQLIQQRRRNSAVVAREQPAAMAMKAKDTLGAEHMTALADRGYFSAPETLACEEAGAIPLVPQPLTPNAKAEGRFDKRDFVYDEAADEYECPAGERAIHRFTTEEKGLTLHKYRSSACPACPIRKKCTTASYRRIARWEHEHVLERMQMLLDARPSAAVVRRQTMGHVFGTLKSWLGTTPLLTKTLPKVRTEVGLAVLAYNVKRMIKIMGTQGMVRAIAA